ncbi:MAG: hypothetical protein HY556_04050 [Euryarchaeota archaeon]|nr:hypothetical protein [Euryarchaeota archaeon]
MRSDLNDIRLLKLAELYETAFEQFIIELAARFVDDEMIRSKLSALSAPDDRHRERIVKEMERLNARIDPADRVDVMRAALLDIRDVETAARDFYIRQADNVRDVRVARLFHDLAREEERHRRIADEAIAMADQRAGRVLSGETLSEELRIMTDPHDWAKSGGHGERHRREKRERGAA